MGIPRRIIPYDPAFLGAGIRVPLPELRGAAKEHAYEDGKVLHYTHFSLVMSKVRRLAIYTACNLDGALAKRVPRSGKWQTDDRIDASLQVGASFYANNPWDKGHLVRRLDPVWGTLKEARDANDATFFYTNAAPQHERFNQDEWLELEDWILDHTTDDAYRVCVFTGPVFRKGDQPLKDAQIPSAFWKLIVARDAASEGQSLLAMAFMMKQDLLWNDGNGAAMNHLTTYQVSVSDIEHVTCLDFGEQIRSADPLHWVIDRSRKAGYDGPSIRKVREPSDLTVWPHDVAGEKPRRRVFSRSSETAATGCGCSSEPFDAEKATKLLAKQVTVDVDALLSRLVSLENYLRSQPGTADIRARLGNPRIVGGVRVDDGEYEDCVCVGDASGYFCTGVLVGENVVLTAGHCTADGIDRVYVGRSVNGTIKSENVYGVRKVIRHPDYRNLSAGSTRARNDIAILLLDRAVSGVNPLPPIDPSLVPHEDPDSTTGEQNILLVGFGNTNRAGDYGFGIKREVRVPIVALRRSASDDLTDIERSHGFNSATELSAGMVDRDTCTGDSGGPAYHVGKAGVVLGVLGLTSRATASSRWACGDNGIYTLVWPYRAWIEGVATAEGGLLSWVGGSTIVPLRPPLEDSAGPFDPNCC